MSIPGDPSLYLAELGKQLTCPICLSLLQASVNLTCNHHFCRPCITEAMKTTCVCPLCKVPTSKREVRNAPHLDSLVAVCRQMEASAAAADEPKIPSTKPSQTPSPRSQQTAAEQQSTDDKLEPVRSRGKRHSPTETSDLRTKQELLKRRENEEGNNAVAIKTPVSMEGRKTGLVCSPEGNFDGKIWTEIARKMNMEIEGSSREGGMAVGQLSLTPVPVKKRTQLFFSDDILMREGEVGLLRDGSLPGRQMKRRVFDKTKGQGEGEGEFCEIPGRGNPLISSPSPSPEVSPRSVKRTDDMQTDLLQKPTERPGFISDLAERQRVQFIRPLKKILSAGTWSLVGCQTEALTKVEKMNPLQEKPKSDTLTTRKIVKVCRGETLNSWVTENDKGNDDKQDEFEEEVKEQETPWETAETSFCNPYLTGEGDKMGGPDDTIDFKMPSSSILNKKSETRSFGNEERVHKGTETEYLGVQHLVKAVKGWLTGEIGGNSRNSEMTRDQSDVLQNFKKVLITGNNRSLSSNEVQQEPEPVLVSGRVRRSFGNMEIPPSDSLGHADNPIIGNATVKTVRNETEPKIQAEPDSQPDWMVEKSQRTLVSKPVTMYTRRLQHGGDNDVRFLDLNKKKNLEELKPLSPQVFVSGEQQKGTEEKGKRKRDEGGNEDCREEEGEGFLEQRISQGGDLCSFCGTSGSSQVTGDMVQVDCRGGRIRREMSMKRHRIQLAGECVHENCLEWAPDVFFQGEKVKNLLPELQRAQRLKCSECGVKGAALGCCLPKCRKTYHYPCARKVEGCGWDEEKFIMLCPEHANGGFPCNNSGEKKNDSTLHRSKKLDSRQRTGSGYNGKWRLGSSSTWVLCGSGLNASGREELVRFAAMAGSSVVKEWSPSVTHVVTGLDGKGRARRTLKFLSAILKGQWVVSLKWLAACTKAGKAVSEEAFEINIDVHDMVGGPKRGRLLSPNKKLFEGISLYFFGEFNSPSKEDLASVFVVGGGTLLPRKPIPLPSEDGQFSSGPNPGLVILFNDFDSLLASPRKHSAAIVVKENAKKMAKELLGFALPHTWLLDSAAKCQILPSDGFRVHGEA